MAKDPRSFAILAAILSLSSGWAFGQPAPDAQDHTPKIIQDRMVSDPYPERQTLSVSPTPAPDAIQVFSGPASSTYVPAPVAKSAGSYSAPEGGAEEVRGFQLRSTYGGWQVRCDPLAKSQPEQCVLTQSVSAVDRDDLGMTAIFRRTGEGWLGHMRLLFPPDVVQRFGVGFHVDNKELGGFYFQYCLPTDCMAEIDVDESFSHLLRNGKTATFVVSQDGEQGIHFPISLAGFGPGFRALP